MLSHGVTNKTIKTPSTYLYQIDTAFKMDDLSTITNHPSKNSSPATYDLAPTGEKKIC